jgi:hypothetical protein
MYGDCVLGRAVWYCLDCADVAVTVGCCCRAGAILLAPHVVLKGLGLFGARLLSFCQPVLSRENLVVCGE